MLTEPIKSRMGGFVQTAFREVRSEPFGSRLSQDASSKKKSPGSVERESGPFLFHPTGDGFLGEFKTEHAEFFLDPRRSPGGVLSGLPGEVSRQYIRQPVRCQRTTVSGMTMMRACFHPDLHRRTRTQKSLSSRSVVRRRGRRFRTASSCRSTAVGQSFGEGQVYNRCHARGEKENSGFIR